MNGGSAATGRELAVSGGEVYLPDSGTVKPGDEKFEDIVREVLPEVAPSLSDHALGRSRGYSVAAVLLILVFLCVVVFLPFLLRPRPPELPITNIDGPSKPELEYSGPFSSQYEIAKQQSKNGQFKAARETLAPAVKEILSCKPVKEKDKRLLHEYFHLFDRMAWDDDALRDLNTLIKIDPDDDNWKLFYIRSTPALEPENGNLRLPNDRKLNFDWRGLVARQQVVDELRKKPRDELKKCEQLDLYKCHLALNLWRLKNFEKREKKPDDAKGEEDREEAWKIAKKYGNNQSFLNIRIYIVSQMLEDGTSGYYIFDGKQYYREKHLKDALRNLEYIRSGNNGGKEK